MNDAVDNRSSMALVPANCSSMRDEASSRVSLYSVEFILPMTVLVVFNVIVIVGNSLVIIAVFTHTKLRTATNMFIVSLAVADLLLGLMVLPFSSANEVTKGYWPFGYIWCRIWLAVDVLLCTASILNLCAISLDRYLAISRPFKYPCLMSPRRAMILVGVVWLVAFVICFPLLVSLTSLDVVPVRTISANQTSVGETTSGLTERDEPTTPKADIQGGSCGNVGACRLETDPRYRIYSAIGSFWIPVWILVGFYWRIYHIAVTRSQSISAGAMTQTSRDSVKLSSGGEGVTLRVHRGRRRSYKTYRECPPQYNRQSRHRSLDMYRIPREAYDDVTDPLRMTDNRKRERAWQDRDNLDRASLVREPSILQKGRCQVRSHLKRLNKEKKAAKTVGVIVGCFILCWAPFFTVYLVDAFCESCTPQLLFTVFFWLGYCNSAVNPCLYALCSNDFRYAFKKLLSCIPERRPSKKKRILALLDSLHMYMPRDGRHGDDNDIVQL